MPIFRVKSVQIYTGQKKFSRTYGMGEHCIRKPDCYISIERNRTSIPPLMKHFLRTCPGTGVAAFTKWGPEEVALQVGSREIFNH